MQYVYKYSVLFKFLNLILHSIIICNLIYLTFNLFDDIFMYTYNAHGLYAIFNEQTNKKLNKLYKIYVQNLNITHKYNHTVIECNCKK